MFGVGENFLVGTHETLLKRLLAVPLFFFFSNLATMASAQEAVSSLDFASPGFESTAGQLDLSVGSLGYLSFGGASVNLQNSDAVETELTSLGFGREFVLDTGLVLDGGFQYRIGDGLRTAVELAYRKDDTDLISLGGYGLGISTDIGGGTTAVTFLANGFYNLLSGGRLKPFIGAGIGFANTNLDKLGRTTDETDRVFAYKFSTGLSFDFNPSLSLRGEYKYFNNADPRYNAMGGIYDGHSVGIDLFFDF